ncbi:hypothetical protein ONZ45_g86 [Pleurotus djamor]|nr:hypothetical protein ONZ45_g86 [Pleurotus djamor]
MSNAPNEYLGTTASCYQDGLGHENPNVRGDDHHHARIDPAQEIARLRHSIALLEAHIFPAHRNQLPNPRRQSTSHPEANGASIIPKKEAIDIDVGGDKDGPGTEPGTLGSQGQGLYAGATSAAMYLKAGEKPEEAGSRHPSVDEVSNVITPEYDRDLFEQLPSIDIMDGLISHYFEYCCWVYRHINQTTFMHNWERFKAGGTADRLVLATACAIMALAVHYLPPQHHILQSFSESYEVVGQKYYELSGTILHRRQTELRSYTLELVELLLIRAIYQTLHKTDPEEIWHILGELVTIAKAMGLHRDPGKWRMPRDVAERRRWAWWHVVLLERWQCFMFGRPLFIASHHFDTQYPSYCSPELDKTGRLYLPNIALFKLAYVLGDIMDDALSVRAVPYENVMANDRALLQWMENLPHELDLDEFKTARNLASPDPTLRRLGVQSIIIRSSYYHIRFTLHRPYASANTGSKSGGDASKTAQSLEIAVNAADKLIAMVDQPDFLTTSSVSVPGHMNWMPWHCFSAGMFFSFQLIANADQPGAGLFRASIKKALQTLDQSRGMPVADKAYNILNALTPLHSPEFPTLHKEDKEREQALVLGTVRKLAFPYQDSQYGKRGTGDSPYGVNGLGTRNLSSPAQSSSLSPPMVMANGLPQGYDSMTAVSSVRSSMVNGHSSGSLPPIYTGGVEAGASTHSPVHPQASPATNGHGYAVGYHHPHHHPHHHHHSPGHAFTGDPRYAHQYVPTVEDPAIWGASVGFGQAEWTQFLDGLRPESNSIRHLPVS